MSSVQQFAPQLQEMGYSFNEATALIGQLDKAGVNTSEVLAAMKKGVGALAKEGISASEGLEQYAEKIKNAGSMTEATTRSSGLLPLPAGSRRPHMPAGYTGKLQFYPPAVRPRPLL